MDGAKDAGSYIGINSKLSEKVLLCHLLIVDKDALS